MPFTVISRILSAICVLIMLLWARDLLTLMGSRGLLDPGLAAKLGASYPLSIFQWIDADSPYVNRAILLLSNSVALFGAILFWRPRSVWAALGLYVTFVGFKQTAVLLTYGVYEFLQLGLFYVLAANVAAYAFRKDTSESWRAERLVGWFFRVHIAMAYVFAGASKAVGPHWWSGESMWRALARSDSTSQRWFNFEWTGQFPLLLQAAGISVVVMECLYPLAFLRKLRPYILGGLAVMHFGTIVSQGLTIFGLTMIALNIFFWCESKEWEHGVPDGAPTPQLAESPA